MKLHELHPAEGSTTTAKRLGRGVGSGLGKTAVPELLRAVETSGAPVHLLQKCGACALLLVNDSQYEQSLRAAYAASRNLHD